MNSASVLAGISRVDDQRERHAGHQRDRREILHRIVGQMVVERLVDGERGRGRQQQRVAVGRGPRHLLGAEGGAGARLVLDDDGAGKPGLQLIGDHAAEQIGGAARRIRHDQFDGLARDRPPRPGPATPSAKPARRQLRRLPLDASTALVLPTAVFIFASASRYREPHQRSRDIAKATKVQSGVCGSATAAITT